MTATRRTSTHPSAGELLRHLDGELGAAAEAKLSRHLARCNVCLAKAEELRGQAKMAQALVRRFPLALPPEGARERALVALRAAETRRRMQPAWRGWAAAAAIAALLVLPLTVAPLRAWVLAGLVAIAPSSEQPTTRVVALPSAVVGAEGSVIAFEPQAGTFELQVERLQTVGEIFLQVRNIGRATAQVTNAGNETMLVLPSGLRIENTPSSSASYRVTLPPSIDRIVLRIGDGVPRVLPLEENTVQWSRSIPLAAGGRE